MFIAAVALMAQGPFQNGFQQGSEGGPLAGFLNHNPGMFSQGGIGPQHLRHPKGGFGKGLVGYLLSEYLELTEAQKEVLKEAREVGRARMMEDVKTLRANQRKIREAARSGLPVQTLAQEQGDLIAQMIVRHAERRSEIESRLALTEEQRAKVEKLEEHFRSRAEEWWNRKGAEPPAAGQP
jgi:Spy/CpxP family protein refolding chaperone